MVRLGGNYNGYYPVWTTEFQFQYGAIGSYHTKTVYRVCFPISIPVWCDWEGGGFGKKARSRTDFNSSMVRLGECVYLVSEGIIHEFQFQYGAIGRSGK